MPRKTTKIEVRPVPGEPERFYVRSGSRDMEHVIDVNYDEKQDRPGRKGRIQCGCEAGLVNGRPCRHLIALATYLSNRALAYRQRQAAVDERIA